MKVISKRVKTFLTAIIKGNPIPIGDQKDVAEFNLCFLSRVEEGLQYKVIREEGEIPAEKMESFGENSLRVSQKNHNDLSESRSNTKTPIKDSKIKFTFSTIKEESVICQTFFGKMNQTIIYTENNETVEFPSRE